MYKRQVIDRPIRPLFPSDLRNDVSVVATVLSVEQDNPPEVAAMIGTSIAISISDVPWNGPIGGVWLGLVDGEYVINPTVEQREKSEMLVTVAGTKQKVVMIEEMCIRDRCTANTAKRLTLRLVRVLLLWVLPPLLSARLYLRKLNSSELQQACFSV